MLHEGQQCLDGMECVAVDRLNGISGLKTGLGGGPASLDTLDADWAADKLRNGSYIADVELLALDGGGDGQGELNSPAGPIDGDGHGLILIQRSALVHLVPGRVVNGVEVRDAVAGLDAGLSGGRCWNYPLDGGACHLMLRRFVDPTVVEEHERERQNEVGHRAGESDEHALPAGMVGERPGVVIGCPGESLLARNLLQNLDDWRVGRSGRTADLVRGFTGHLDVAA
jgi:hypothetical protein